MKNKARNKGYYKMVNALMGDKLEKKFDGICGS